MSSPLTFDVSIVLKLSSNCDAPIVDAARLRVAFQRYFAWRKEVYARNRNLIPLQWAATKCETALFPLMPPTATAKVVGRDRDLASQISLAYEGTSGGMDAISYWAVAPLGTLIDAVVERVRDDNAAAAAAFVLNDGAYNVNVADVRIAKTLAATTLPIRDRAIELHALVAFVTYFECADVYTSGGDGRALDCWEPFPACAFDRAGVTGDAAFVRDDMLAAMRGVPLHRGSLLFGPAGTGKSQGIRALLKQLRMHCVWDRRAKEAVVGSGAVLKGGLQGDLEMRIYALFMRAGAAPWLPTAITIDEIDFTAPSRASVGSESSGGNLWLQLLSDHVRPPHVTFLATTNVRTNCLEQLVDRLDNVFVGLLPWDANGALFAFARQQRHWLADVRASHEQQLVVNDRDSVPYWQAVLLGMPPRAVLSLRQSADVRRVLLAANPWPTLTSGPTCVRELLGAQWQSVALEAGGDCARLLRFLLRAAHDKLLTGRMLIDTTRLREQLIVVDIELHGAGADDLVLAMADGARHFHAAARQGRGSTYTRTYVLAKQKSEAPLWAVLAHVAVAFRATHCTYVSDAFLHSTCGGGGGGSTSGGADERNRQAIETAISQYVTACASSVTVMPLRYARIQKSDDRDDGASSIVGSSSTIHAHEVWDMLTAGWRCQVGKQQLFALVASEPWEIDAVLGSAAMAFNASEYRALVAESRNDERACVVCQRVFATTSRVWHDTLGCAHAGQVVTYDGANWNEPSVCREATLRSGATSDRGAERLLRAKWTCCGKPFLEPECAAATHRAEPLFDSDTARRGKAHANQAHWWCNVCCNACTANECH